MLIFLPAIVLFLTALTLLILILIKPEFRYHWLIAILGATLSVIGVFLWQAKVPHTFSLPIWKPESIFLYSLSWLSDDISWSYSLSLTALGLATIITAVLRKFTSTLNWVSILIFISMGLLSVTAENPLTLVITWFAMDIIELVTLLRIVKEDNSEKLIVGFSIRSIGIFLLLWASIVSISSGLPFSFREIPEKVGFLIMLSAFIRLGIIPSHLPIPERDQRRGIMTILRLVSAASGFSLIARIPSTAISSPFLPYLIIFIGILIIICGWMWMQSTDELTGRPYLIAGFGFLAISAMLLENSHGSAAWGISLILSGGLLFLHSSRGRNILWILIIGFWELSTLPFSLTAAVWQNYSNLNYLFLIPHLIGYAFILSGYFKHAFNQQGEINIGLEPRWVQVIYPIGLSVLPVIMFTISLKEWFQTRTFGLWWVGSIIVVLALIIYFLFNRYLKSPLVFKFQYQPGKVNFFTAIFWSIYHFFRRIITLLTSILEGDGGMLWSIVIIVLFITIISQLITIPQ